MTSSVAARVASQGRNVLVATLVVVGLGTAAVLHIEHTRALDEALLAAVHGRAHPNVEREVEVEHSRSPVDTWLVTPRDRRVPPAASELALRQARPVFMNVGDERLVLLRFELEGHDDVGGEHGDDDDDHHADSETELLAAAAAPRVTVLRSVGAFLLVYGLASVLAALAATWVLGRVVRGAFVPIDRARDEVSRVVGLGGDARLTEDGPVEVRSLLAAINALLGRLDDAFRAQSRFTAEAAHELRTPVTAMLGELDVALRAPRSADEYRALLVSSRDEVERLRRLVEGLTALARIDAGQVERGREPVRAAELAASALAAEQKTLERAGNQARLQVNDDPELLAHRSLVEIALCNLLRNAARHAPGKEVVLTVSVDGEHATFDVDDAGSGLPLEQREAMFDRFARAGASRLSDRSGLGLGLPLAREVARRHGGECSLESSPLGGVRARLRIKR